MAKPDFQNLPTRLGVYSLTRHIGQNANTALYLATQSHVERGVIVEVLNPESSQEEVEHFLNTVRARVAVHLPHVCQVFESMVSDEIWYLTLERPEGRNLTKIIHEKRSLSSLQVCAVISAAAELYLNAQEQGVAAGLLSTDYIFMNGEQGVSFLSPVIPGVHSQELIPLQMDALAAALYPVLPQGGVPGQSRVATLMDWMANGYEGQRLDWSSIAETANTIREQLAPQLRREHVRGLSGITRGAVVRQNLRTRRKFIRNMWYAGAGVVICLITGIAGCLCAPDNVPLLPPNDGIFIHCRAGNATVRVAAQPVTIREYKEFLSTFNDRDKTPRERKNQLRKGVPQACLNHTPLEWEQQLRAAREGKEFHGVVLTEDSPVRGLCYWDALVYARYSGGSLPEAELLQAAHKECTGKADLYEWTSGKRSATTLFTEGFILLNPTKIGAPTIEGSRDKRSLRYGARVVFPSDSSEK